MIEIILIIGYIAVIFVFIARRILGINPFLTEEAPLFALILIYACSIGALIVAIHWAMLAVKYLK